MSPALDDLVAVLVAEAEEYQRLVPLLEDEERVLVRADAAALAELAAQRAAVLDRLAKLERQRRTAIARVARDLGIAPGALTVSRLVELVPAAAQRLAAVRQELCPVLDRLRARVRRNRFLAERTLECLRGLFAAISSALTPIPVYAQTGHSDHPAHDLRLVDRRA
jgi:flagellar biosynthesis/type III secretory pathway chaperone